MPSGATRGERVQLARAIAGLSRKELAQGVGVSEKTLQRIEDGTRELRVSELERIASLTGQVSSFFGASPDRQVEAPTLALLPGAVNPEKEA